MTTPPEPPPLPTHPALDVGLTVPAPAAATRARELAACGVDGLFTFEGPHDVFFPLVATALAGVGVDLYTNVAIAFPRSPFHLAQQGREMQDLARGRFALGLGTQVRAHIERRYSGRWESPVTRMAELVGLLREIWQAWETGGTVDHRGRHYRLDLLPPLFRPPPSPHPPPPVWVGALGPRLTRAMAGVADGVIVHPFVTGEVVRDHTLARLAEGLESSGRHRSDLSLVVGVIVAMSSDEETLERATRAARANVAFYASTPAYRLTLDHHGLGELQPRLRELTRRGDWGRLTDLVDDEVLDLVAVRGTPAEVAAELDRRYGAVADRLALTVAPPTRDEDLAALTATWRTRATTP